MQARKARLGSVGGVALFAVLLAWLLTPSWEGGEEEVVFTPTPIVEPLAADRLPQMPPRKPLKKPKRKLPPDAPTPEPEVEEEEEEEELEDVALLTVRIVGGGWLRPLDCAIVEHRRTGAVHRLMVEEGSCTLRAERRDGMLRIFGADEQVYLEAGDRASLTLTLPQNRQAGVGIAFQPDRGGMRVRQLVPGSPAERAGLSPGDLVVQVEGISTADMSLEDFVDVMTGEEGSDVSFVIGWDADTGWTESPISVSRAPIGG